MAIKLSTEILPFLSKCLFVNTDCDPGNDKWKVQFKSTLTGFEFRALKFLAYCSSVTRVNDGNNNFILSLSLSLVQQQQQQQKRSSSRANLN
jgi:hypothetical protein